MDPAPLERRHRLQLEHLAGLRDALGRTRRELGKLAFAPAAVVLHVHEDSRPLAGPAREHEVHEVLERGQPLALAPDERPEGLAVRTLADDVEPAGLTLANLHDDALEAEVPHQRLEDLLAGRERLGRRFCRLELRALHRERAARRRPPRKLGRRQLRAPLGAGLARAAVVAARAAVVTPRTVVPARGAVRAVVATG